MVSVYTNMSDRSLKLHELHFMYTVEHHTYIVAYLEQKQNKTGLFTLALACINIYYKIRGVLRCRYLKKCVEHPNARTVNSI